MKNNDDYKNVKNNIIFIFINIYNNTNDSNYVNTKQNDRGDYLRQE